MVVFLFIILVLLLSVLVNKLIWGREITIQEMLINALAVVFLFSVLWVVTVSAKLSDVEILNGKVTEKHVDRVSCEHSYPCHCRQVCSGSGKDKYCSEYCDTCYDHSYDNRYTVESTVGEFWIQRIDRQGLKEPPRYTEVKAEDSVAKQHSYNNYIKASDSSLFKDHVELSEEEIKTLPTYPLEVTDYYKINRVIDQTNLFSGEELNAFNFNIAKSLNDLGDKKQVNLVFVVTKNTEDYALKLLSYWNGGKKNDVIVVIGLKEDKEITFVRVQSWATDSIFNIKVRDSIVDLGKIDDLNKPLSLTTQSIEAHYNRRPFEEFAYLKWSAMPSDITLAIFVTISLAISIGLGYYFSKENF